MKKTLLTAILLLLFATLMNAQAVFSVLDRYKYYGENLAGRQVMMNSVDSVTSVSCLTEGEWRNVPVRSISKGNYELILPEQIGVSRNDTVSLRLFYRKKLLQEKALPVPKMRHWTVMIFPHSHVDVGYTHTQDVVEFIHRQNIDMAIELAERTKDYPEDARFRWNTEVTWPMERYLAKASPEKRDRVLDAIRKGYVSVDNSYSNTNTTATHEPELVELFSSAHRINELTGVDTYTMIQVDIPGFTWGIPALASLTGVRNIISLPNGGARVGRARNLDFSPRYWIGPDGKSKVLFIQPGPYCDATLDKREPWFFDNLGMRDTLALPRVITTDNPRRMFIDGTVDTYLPMLEAREGYFYDIFPMSWCLSDNVPLDGDLPDAVKSWNEEYAYPHLKICTSSDIVRAYEKYSDRIPVVSGDYTEYWTDGLGTAAYQTGHHREVKEELAQAEILSAMTCRPLPMNEIGEAWRHALLGTEHTWCYIYPDQEISDEILDVKFGCFRTADSLKTDLMRRVLPSCPDIKVIAVFNTESFARVGCVSVEPSLLGGATGIADFETGETIPSQILSDGSMAFMSGTIPALSCRKYLLRKAKAVKTDVPPVDGVLDNGKVRLVVDQHSGNVVSLAAHGREFINQKTGIDADSYRYLPGGQPTFLATGPYDVKLEWAEYGPVQKTLKISSKADGCNSLVRRLTLFDGSDEVLVENEIDKIATTAKEGVHFGFSFNMDNDFYVTMDVPWGVARVDCDQWPEGNRNWITMQRWVNVSDSDSNVTICALNSPVFEVGDMTANTLELGSNWIASTPRVPTIWFWALNNHWFTNFPLSQEGLITYRYVLLPREGRMDAAQSVRFAQSASRKLICSPVPEDFAIQAPFRLESGPEVSVSCVRFLEDGYLVFLHSVADDDQTVELVPSTGAEAFLCDAWGNVTATASTSYSVPANGITVVRITRH